MEEKKTSCQIEAAAPDGFSDTFSLYVTEHDFKNSEYNLWSDKCIGHQIWK